MMNIRVPKFLSVGPINRRRYVLIVAAVLIVVGVIYRFYPDLRGLISSKEEIMLIEAKIVKYRKAVDSGKDLRPKLAGLKKHLDSLESRLLTGKTPSLAGVEVQEIIQKIASKSNLSLQRVRALEPKELNKSGYLTIPVDFALSPNIRKLKEILYGIESSHIFLKVTELKVRYHRSLKYALQCQLTVTGLMKKPTSKNTGL